jgi:hypothetical protein
VPSFWARQSAVSALYPFWEERRHSIPFAALAESWTQPADAIRLCQTSALKEASAERHQRIMYTGYRAVSRSVLPARIEGRLVAGTAKPLIAVAGRDHDAARILTLPTCG